MDKMNEGQFMDEKQSMDEAQLMEGKRTIEVQSMGGGEYCENDVVWRKLAQAALEAREMAYTPYSHYTVGAALLTAQGEIYRGGNIENASYGATNCAERTAIFKAVSEGRRQFLAIAIAGGMEEKEPVDYAYPCGICRQVMQEFAGADFRIIVARSASDYKVYRLEELLPYGFGDIGTGRTIICL